MPHSPSSRVGSTTALQEAATEAPLHSVAACGPLPVSCVGGAVLPLTASTATPMDMPLPVQPSLAVHSAGGVALPLLQVQTHAPSHEGLPSTKVTYLGSSSGGLPVHGDDIAREGQQDLRPLGAGVPVHNPPRSAASAKVQEGVPAPAAAASTAPSIAAGPALALVAAALPGKAAASKKRRLDAMAPSSAHPTAVVASTAVARNEAAVPPHGSGDPPPTHPIGASHQVPLAEPPLGRPPQLCLKVKVKSSSAPASAPLAATAAAEAGEAAAAVQLLPAPAQTPSVAAPGEHAVAAKPAGLKLRLKKPVAQPATADPEPDPHPAGSGRHAGGRKH